MDINQIYIAKETSCGFRLIKACKLIELDSFNLVPAGVDEYYLEKKCEYKKVSWSDIGKYSFTNCKIKESSINNGLISVKTLIKLLSHLYQQINNANKIIKNSKLNITKVETGSIKIKGKEYIKELNICYPKPEPNLCLHEIQIQSEVNNIKIDVKIELANKEQIRIK